MSLPDISSLSAEQVPEEHRAWVERAVLVPLNRFLGPVAALLNRGLGLANANAQLLERTVLAVADWTTAPQEFASKLAGPCIGLWAVRALEVDSSGHPNGGIHAGLPLADWEERVSATRGRVLRIRNQPGLTAGHTYQLAWLAIGA